MRGARPLLVECLPSTGLRDVARGWSDRVDVVTAESTDARASALLVRPDGYVAWAGDTADTPESARAAAAGLRRALARWFGAERAAVR